MSTFGTLFRVTTFGESHCRGVGAIVDGCPPNLPLTEADIQPQLTRRRPGQSRLTTPRSETDTVTILSGTERGVTLGTPIALLVPNANTAPGDYVEMSDVPRPGHADYTYQVKYGTRASSGGGRASARETIGRVAAGAIAESWLAREYGTRIVTFVSSVGTVDLPSAASQHPSGRPWTREEVDELGTLTILRVEGGEGPAADATASQIAADEAAFAARSGAWSAEGVPAYEDARGVVYDRTGAVLPGVASAAVRSTEVVATRCPHAPTAAAMATLIREVKAANDSTGGVVTTVVTGVPVGLGEPVFDKTEALLAHAMLSLPATKGFEIGSGFAGTRLRGSEHNDAFVASGSAGEGASLLRTRTNHAGGTLGGITSGSDLYFRVPVKPVSTISQPQVTATYGGEVTVLETKGRHDACVLPRCPPLFEAMTALVLADLALIQRARGPVLVLPPLAGPS